jgi:hypothetical protein
MSDCIITDWSLGRDGYGRKMIGGVYRRAHRVAWAEANGFDFRKLTPDMVIRHTCDVPACVNPEHLLLGTTQDNTRDRQERDRHRNQHVDATYCIRGHEFTPANTRTYTYPDGRTQRFCRECKRGERQRA